MFNDRIVKGYVFLAEREEEKRGTKSGEKEINVPDFFFDVPC